jgi:4-amino-4-deoxy-L-arabinose transferase-like glycosyltransferase
MLDPKAASRGAVALPVDTPRPWAPTLLSIDRGVLVLVVAWLMAIGFVDPRGEFPVNDDWSFRLTLERLLHEGRLGTTGWGPDQARGGGPSLVAHLLWAAVFVRAFGLSFLTLRASVLCLGLVGVICVYTLLRRQHGHHALALWGAGAVAFNPLFFSQSFTFMSDVSFTALLCVAVLVLVSAIERDKTWMFLLGQVASLAAVLTRQLGLALPLALLVLAIAHPTVRRFGQAKVFTSTLLIVLLPWLCFELALWHMGSSPVTQHAVTHRLVERMSGPPLRVITDLLGVVFHHGLFYLSVLLAPVTLLTAPGPCARRKVRRFLWVLTAACALLIAATSLGLLRIPVLLHRNVITPWGIGPIVLKDVTSLHIPRFEEIPQALWCVCLYVAATSAVLLVAAVWPHVRGLWQRRLSAPVVCSLSSITCLLYMAVITLSDYQDRYLIPASALLVIALLSGLRSTPPLWTRLAALPTFLALFALAVLGTRDFMEVKRAQMLAHDHLRGDLGVSTCETDSGFEWNGYYCYRADFEPGAGRSQWWVTNERYVVALGGLPGFRVVRTYPFRRLLGRDGSVHLLQSVSAR